MIFESNHPDVINVMAQANQEFSTWVQEVTQWVEEYADNRELRPAIARNHNISMDVIGLLDDPDDDRNWEKVETGGTTYWRPNGNTRVSKTIQRELQQLTWRIPELPGMPRTWVKTDWTAGSKQQHRYGTELYGDVLFVTWGCDGVDADMNLWGISTQERLDAARAGQANNG